MPGRHRRGSSAQPGSTAHADGTDHGTDGEQQQPAPHTSREMAADRSLTPSPAPQQGRHAPDGSGGGTRPAGTSPARHPPPGAQPEVGPPDRGDLGPRALSVRPDRPYGSRMGMTRAGRRATGQDGQSSLEWLGVTAVVVVIIAVLVAMAPGMGGSAQEAFRCLVERVSGGAGCEGAAAQGAPERACVTGISAGTLAAGRHADPGTGGRGRTGRCGRLLRARCR